MTTRLPSSHRANAPRLSPALVAIATAALGPGPVGCAGAAQITKVVVEGESRALRERKPTDPAGSTAGSPLLILGIDGIGKDLLYGMLQHGELPELAALLGGDGRGFPHAYFAPGVVTTMPSTTGVAWATMFTGVPPAQHGFMGNEFFVREKREFAAPIPVSVSASASALAVFTEGYANRFLLAPTVYETMRTREPSIDIWVSMSQFYGGADRLLMTRRSVLVAATAAFLSGHTEKTLPRSLWADLDKEDVDVLVDKLKDGPVPDVLTLYMFGSDDWAHIAPDGPDVARTGYLKEVVDPAIGALRRRLVERHALDGRYVVLMSDHGHTEVRQDDAHALAVNAVGDPPELLRKAGFRVRPFEGKVKDDDPFQAVLAYEGAVAYVYLADRSTCVAEKAVCDWSVPPRYKEDVLPLADAFYRNNLDGTLVPQMKGVLDLVLARKPVAVDDDDLPFEVYVGDGKTEALGSYLEAHPHPTYVNLPSRLHDLAVGPHGERAGDVLLLAHNGDRADLDDRYYFATPYHSWHGSPSAQDSRIPLIVASPEKTSAELGSAVRSYLTDEGRAQDIGRLIVGLRARGAQPLPRRSEQAK